MALDEHLQPVAAVVGRGWLRGGACNGMCTHCTSSVTFLLTTRMHLYYYLGEDGKRVYTLKKKDPEGKV